VAASCNFGIPLAAPSGVKVLEARFHPDERSNDSAFVVVAYLVWRGRGRRRNPIVRPSRAVGGTDVPSTMLSKLRYLIGLTAPDSFEGLQALRSRFWSFVDVTR